MKVVPAPLMENHLARRKNPSQSRAEIALTILTTLVNVSLRLITADMVVGADVHPVPAAAPVPLQAAAVAVDTAAAVMPRQIKKTAVQLISRKTDACE